MYVYIYIYISAQVVGTRFFTTAKYLAPGRRYS